MNKLDLFLSILVLIYVTSCTKPMRYYEDVSVDSWYYEDGTLRAIQENKGSTAHGKSMYFYPSGILKDFAIFNDDKIHGKRFEFYETGKLQKQTTVKLILK